jgi:hypothetical protein
MMTKKMALAKRIKREAKAEGESPSYEKSEYAKNGDKNGKSPK